MLPFNVMPCTPPAKGDAVIAGIEVLGVSDGGGYQYPKVLGIKMRLPTAIGAFSVPELFDASKFLCETSVPPV